MYNPSTPANMSERLKTKILEITGSYPNSSMVQSFLIRLEGNNLFTRDENPASHFCVFFAAYDQDLHLIFIGHHKKSGLWLFNGGHIDPNETPDETLIREMGEEWGIQINVDLIGTPQLLTITDINNPTKQTCTRHYDIWYFVPVDSTNFYPDKKLLAQEFHENIWLETNSARKLITDPNTNTAIDKLEQIFHKNKNG
jgi:8-oxo-dGTP pyrophosphatase MutT (NUDIX family)